MGFYNPPEPSPLTIIIRGDKKQGHKFSSKRRSSMGSYRLIVGALFLLSITFEQGSLYAQQQPAGVVTAVQGQAQLTRQAQPTQLRQKDGILIRDIIDTREKSSARMLFGGKASVTVRELSRFEVQEETLPGGATRSTVQLNSGAILVNVARQLMKPGDEIIINTNNAVAAVRGSMVYAEAVDAARSTFAQLSGEALLRCPPPATSPSANLTRFTATEITGQGVNCNVGEIRNITEEFAALLLRPFQLPRAVGAEANGATIVKNGIADTAVIADAALVTGQTPTLPSPTPPGAPPPLPGGNIPPVITTIKLPKPIR
ncbi:MAG TPA: FecR domain-containing protein [Candidatus Binatia bacterium]